MTTLPGGPATSATRREGRSPTGAAWARLVVLVVVAALLARHGRSTLAVVVLVSSLALLGAAVAVPGKMAALDRALVHGVGRVARGILFGPLAVFIGVVVHGAARSFRFDALRGSAACAPRGWVDLRPDGRPRSIGGPGLRSRGGRLRGRAAALAVVAAVVVAAIAFNRLTGIGPDPAPPSSDPSAVASPSSLPSAQAGEPFAAQLRADQSSFPPRYDPVFGVRVPDGHTALVNVEDRVRQSWEPAVDGPTVWFFGGSTMFGIGQRDAHTIPSEVARLASSEGAAIRPVNFGVPGMVQVQEAQLFGYLLASRAPPDMAVFYDGCNDMYVASGRILDGGDPSEPTSLFADQVRSALEAQNGAPDALAGGPASRQMSEAEAIELGARQYRDGVAMTEGAARSRSIPLLFTWQPVLSSRQPHAADEPLVESIWGADPADSWQREDRILRGIAEQSEVEPLDLTDSLDQVDEAVYDDWCHTNELGARTVATAMWPAIREALDAG